MGRKRDTAGQRMLPGTRPPAQECRQILVVCVACGCRVRMTRMWIRRGCPQCQCGGQMAPLAPGALRRFNQGQRNRCDGGGSHGKS